MTNLITIRRWMMLLLFSFFVSSITLAQTDSASGRTSGDKSMRLGNFSVSLTVKDIARSREFYEKLGFHVILGDQKKNWLILQNETSTIGLFQGMFNKNTMTFNPWLGQISQNVTGL